MKNQDQPRRCKKTTIGGQALLEGLMMVGPNRTALAVRRRSGEIHLEMTDPLKPTSARRIPILRGAVGIFQTLVHGTKAMMRTAELIEEDDRIEQAKLQQAAEGIDRVQAPVAISPEPRKKSTEWILYGATLVGLVFGVVLFVLLPNLLASWILPVSEAAKRQFSTGVTYNLLEGFFRFLLLIGYFYLTRHLSDIRRIWQYHGAEHKTIACYEAGLPLTVENVQAQSRFHPRCGTSFLFLFIFLSIFLFSLVGWYSIPVNLLIRLLLVPLLAGLSYEVLRWSGRHDQLFLGRLTAKPGLWVQRLTTEEPDDAMCEVAIEAMQAVIPEEAQADEWR